MFSSRLLQAIYEWSHPVQLNHREGSEAVLVKEDVNIQTDTCISEQFAGKTDPYIPQEEIPLCGKSYISGYTELSVCACHQELSLDKPLRIELVDDIQKDAETILKSTPPGSPKSVRILSVGSGMLLQEALIVIALAQQADVIFLDLIDNCYSFGHPSLSKLLSEFIHLIGENCEHDIIAGSLSKNAASRLLEKTVLEIYSNHKATDPNLAKGRKQCIIQFFHKIDVYVQNIEAPVYQQGTQADSILLPQIGIEVDVYSYSVYGHCNINRLMKTLPHLSTWYNISTEVHPSTNLFTGIRFQKSLKVREDWLNVADEPISRQKLRLK